MPTTSPAPIAIPESDESHRAAMTGVVKILMGRAGIRSRSALAMAAKPWISQSTLYSRMNLETDWSAHDLRCLSRMFEVPPSVFFAEPTLAGIAPHLGITPTELGEELALGQNWKKMMGPDLQILAGGGEDGTGQDGSKRGRADLRLV